MTGVSAANRQIAQAVLTAFGGAPPRVLRYWDEPEENSVDIAIADDVPDDATTSCATLGLSDTPIVDDGKELAVRVELVGACADRYDKFTNILSTAAFCIIKDRWFAYPGRIFPEIVAMYYPSSTMQHLLLVPPFLWDERLRTEQYEDKTVAWLQLVPISEAELRYARRQAHLAGDDNALSRMFDRTKIDVFDLDRPSVL